MPRLSESNWLAIAMRIAANEHDSPDEDGVYADKRESIEIGFAFADEFRRQYELRVVDAANVFNPDVQISMAAKGAHFLSGESADRIAGFLSMIVNTDPENIVGDSELPETVRALLSDTIEGIGIEAGTILRELGFKRSHPGEVAE